MCERTTTVVTCTLDALRPDPSRRMRVQLQASSLQSYSLLQSKFALARRTGYC